MTTIAASAAPAALVQGIALQEAALRALGPLLDAVGVWHGRADTELAAVLHADDDTRRRVSDLATIATEAHADLLRLVQRTEHRLAGLRGYR